MPTHARDRCFELAGFLIPDGETQEEAEETDGDSGELLAMENAETLPLETDAGNIINNDAFINSLFQNAEEPEEEISEE